MNASTKNRCGKNVLYISYDGILEPLGESQVLRYLERLSATQTIVLVSFEKRADWNDTKRLDQLRDRVLGSGITWVPLRYHKQPSAVATAFDIARGILVCIRVTLRYDIRIAHARSYVPSVIALALKRLFGLKYVFDMRGFWADERVDGGLWEANGRLYRLAKWFERKFLLNADCVVSLTHRAADEINTFPYLRTHAPRIEVITTCTDLSIFRPAVENGPGHKPESQFILGYVGSVGTWYLFDEVLRFFRLFRARRPGAILHILNRDDRDYIYERLRTLDIDPAHVVVEAGEADAVADTMRTMDAGIFFIKPVHSKIASAPTRLGEFLATGIPCLSNSGVGDLQSILENDRVGITVDGFSDRELEEAAVKLLDLAADPEVAQRCRATATRYFSLSAGVAAYEDIYRSLQ